MCQPFIFPLIAFEDLIPVMMNAAEDLIRMISMPEYTLDKCKFLVMPDILRIYGVKITFAKAEIMNGIQNIGFTNTVVPYKAIDTGRETYFNFLKILKVNQG
jgi:hypothetical protein